MYVNILFLSHSVCLPPLEYLTILCSLFLLTWVTETPENKEVNKGNYWRRFGGPENQESGTKKQDNEGRERSKGSVKFVGQFQINPPRTLRNHKELAFRTVPHKDSRPEFIHQWPFLVPWKGVEWEWQVANISASRMAEQEGFVMQKSFGRERGAQKRWGHCWPMWKPHTRASRKLKVGWKCRKSGEGPRAMSPAVTF